MTHLTKKELMEYVGQEATVSFYDGTTVSGKLGYTESFSAEFGYRKPDFFTIGDYDFKVSHIKDFTPTEHKKLFVLAVGSGKSPKTLAEAVCSAMMDNKEDNDSLDDR